MGYINVDVAIESKLYYGGMLTPQEQVYWYRKGNYAFPPPPVCTARWGDCDWANFIQNQGKWLPRKR